MKKFVNLHLHSHFSNVISYPEVINKPSEYIEYAVNNELPAMTFTEHGSNLSWVSKKQQINKVGMKYIHGVEAYISQNVSEKVRDNNHLILLARNYEGVKEINSLIANSFVGVGQEWEIDNRHYYYAPRMSFEEIKNTSDNIFILTACLGSPLWQSYKNNYKDYYNEWVDFLVGNKHRVWLELQPHDDKEQKMYNKMLLDLADKHDMNIVATNDVHAIDEESNRVRKILSKSKGISFDDEDSEDHLELWLKNYNQMYNSFKIQGVLTDEQITQALDETIRISELVDDFEFDKSFKYPKMYDNSEEVFKKKILEGYKEKGLINLPKEEQKKYKKRVNEELRVYKSMNSVDFMLLMEYIDDNARSNGHFPGYARGSVSGSLIAWLLDIVEIDPIKEDLNFARFMNPARAGTNLSDIDTDFESSSRDWVVKFLLTSDKFNCSAIVTYNTLGIKGAIKDIGRAMGYDSSEMNFLTSSLPLDEKKKEIITDEVREKYPELIDTALKVVGVVTSIGRHAGGYVVTNNSIAEELGMVYVKDSPYPVSAVAMKEVESLFYVKMDILGLDNIGLVNRTCKLADIPRATPFSDYIDFKDLKVIKDVAEDSTAIFQFEGQRAQKLLSEMFADTTIEKMKNNGINVDPVNQLALLNAAMRPGAASIIDDISVGIAKDNGHPALNDLLRNTNGYLIYQEDIIAFLVKFCGRTEAEADLLRRGIGHKAIEIMEVEIPKVKEEFVETMVSKFNDTEEHAREIVEPFIKILTDASDYSFSRNHAIPYSYIGYNSAFLRYYYPLEFCTAALQIWKDNQEKTNSIIAYAKKQGIDIKSPKFKRSKGDYFFDKETNSIYQGTAPIKGMNARAGDDLFSMRDVEFDNWLDFLLYIKDGSTITIDGSEYQMHLLFTKFTEEEIKQLDKDIKANPDKYEIKRNPYSSLDKRNMEPLIRLGYFAEFGKPAKLLATYLLFLEKYKPNNKTYAGKYKNFQLVKDFWENQEVEDFKIAEELETELYYTGRVTKSFEKIPAKYGFVTAIDVKKTRSTAQVFNIRSGKMVEIKVGSRLFKNVPFEQGDIIEIREGGYKPKSELVSGKWVKSKTKKEYWVTSLFMFHKNKMFGKKK